MSPCLPNHAGKAKLWPMSGHWQQRRWRAKVGAQFVTMFTAGALLYAGMICLSGAALGEAHSHDDHGHAAEATEDHHGTPASAPQNHHEGGAADCCSTHISTVPSSDPSLQKPHSEAPSHMIVAVLMVAPSIVPSSSFLWEHGPPGESPPLLFAILPQAPRAPPVAV